MPTIQIQHLFKYYQMKENQLHYVKKKVQSLGWVWHFMQYFERRKLKKKNGKKKIGLCSVSRCEGLAWFRIGMSYVHILVCKRTCVSSDLFNTSVLSYQVNGRRKQYKVQDLGSLTQTAISKCLSRV